MSLDRVALSQTLRNEYPWLDAHQFGPRAVDAGSCDRCQTWPRLLPTCGPAAVEALCRDCADQVGDDGWCAGHAPDGEAARRWAAALPDEWATVVTLWWVATGELRVAEDVLADERVAVTSAPCWPGRRADTGLR